MRASTLVLLAAVVLTGCRGRSLTVRDARPGDVRLVEGKQFERVYFVPFTMNTVALEGAHGEGAVLEDHKANWFVHLAAGAQLEMNKRMKGSQVVIVGSGPSGHGRQVMEKFHLKLEWAEAVPAGALAISGRYISSREVSGASRFWGGMMSGKSWTRGAVGIRVGEAKVFDCVVDGKFLGGGWDWGYETFGANEALGRGIVDVVSALQKGKKVKSE